MQNITSNQVYVVSLGIDQLGQSGLSFKVIVVNHDRYFHPVGGGPGDGRRSRRTTSLSVSTASFSRSATSKATKSLVNRGSSFRS
jgi:hypothetical protein